MKIVNVYNGYVRETGQGGGVRYIRNLLQCQHQLNEKDETLSISILGLGGERNETLDIEGVSVNYVELGRTHNWRVFILRLFFHLSMNRRLYNTPSTVFHLHRSYFSPVIRMLAPKARIVLTVHTQTFQVFELKYPRLTWLVSLFIKIEGQIIHHCIDQLSAAGDRTALLYNQRHDVVIEDMPTLMPVQELPIVATPFDIPQARGRKILLQCGRLTAVKRPLAAVELFQKGMKLNPALMENFCLVFAGAGDQGDELSAFIEEAGLEDSVFLLGEFEAPSMPRLYEAVDFLLLLSTDECAPYTLYESLFYGNPIFATRVGTVPALVSKECGMTIPVEEPEKQVDAFIDFLSSTYSREACKLVARRYRDDCNRQVENLISDIYSYA